MAISRVPTPRISCATYWRLTALSIVAAAALTLTGCAGMSRNERATAGVVMSGS